MSYAISLSGTTVSIASPGPRGIGVPAGGTSGQVLSKASDTNYDFAWGAASAGITDIVSDTTPQLGGSLDVNGKAIVSVSNGNIAITPNGTGKVVLDGLDWPTSDGSANQVLKTDGSGSLTFGNASVVATTLDLTDTPSSYGTAGEVLAVNSGTSALEFVANVASGSYALDSGTVAEGSITDVVALTAAQYADITSPDAKTLFVLTDGTTSIGDSDDVTITGTPADHSFLVYDSSTSDFINRTAAQAQADLGISAFGTTLIDDADAAACRTTLGLGTLATASTITDSYTGQIETAADKTYTIDPGAVAARTITGFYIKSASGTCTATLKVGTNTVKAASVSSSSGDQSSLANTAVAVNDVITLVVSSNSSALDVIFSVEYTQ